MRWHNRLCICVFGLLPLTAIAAEINAAVASNFAATMNEIATVFEKEHGHSINLSFGSSGKFHAQIKNGAPFQIFFSADQEKPRQLIKEGLAVPGTGFTYAIGRLALWSAESGLVDPEAKVLQQGDFKKLAVANPMHAPYGQAALEVLQHLGLAAAARPKLVMGENIAQAHQFVDSGNAELGFVALAQISDKNGIKHGSAWIVPAALHNPIRQDAVLLKAGADNKAAVGLLKFMQGARAKSIIAAYGYLTAE